jgi:hypothetical protein
MLKRLGLLTILLLLLVGVLGGYFWLVNTPEYAMVDLAQNLENQNYTRIDERINFEQVTGHVADVIAQQQSKRVESQNKGNDVFSQFGRGLGLGIVQVMKPALINQATLQIKNAVTDPRNAPYVKDLGNKTLMLVLGQNSEQFKLTKKAQSGSKVQFELVVETNHKTREKLPVQLEWQHPLIGGWELTKIDVPDEHLARWMGQALPVAVQQAATPQAAELVEPASHN